MFSFLHDIVVNVVLTTPLVGAYMMFALGIVFIYRASRVLNLAHGAMAMLPAFIFYSVAKQMGLGVVPGLIVALVAGGALGLAVERLVVRRLRGASQMGQTVGTVAVLGLLIALAIRGWGTTPIHAPSVFPAHTFHVGGSLLQLGDIGLFVGGLVVAAAFMALFKFTNLGLDMRCAADNRRAARLMGIDPDRTTAMAWMFAGVLAALGGVLLGASTNLHPFTLSLQVLPAFVAALIGGLESVPGAVIGSIIVGLAVGTVPSIHGIGDKVGAPQLALTILAFAVMAFRGKRFSVATSGGEGQLVAAPARPPTKRAAEPVPDATVDGETKTDEHAEPSTNGKRGKARPSLGVKPVRPIKARYIILAWLVFYFPWLPGFPMNHIVHGMPTSFVLDANTAGYYTLVAFSLVLLTGWVGQISLGQGAFVGVGAFATGVIVRKLGIPFPINLPIVVLITAGVAALLGVAALRVRGLYLAVATLIFAWMCDAYLFTSDWLVGSAGASSIKNHVIGKPNTFTLFDFSNPRVMYLILAAVVGAVWYALINLRDSKTGRAFFAVRGSEMAAVSLGIDVTKYKLMAFALAGALAGVAGCLYMTNNRSATPTSFQFTVSLFFLSLVVVGGIRSLGGALGAGILFAALGEAFYRFSFLNGWLDVVSVALLLAVLLLYPGGLGALGSAVAWRLQELFHRLWAPMRERMARPPAYDGTERPPAVELATAPFEVEEAAETTSNGHGDPEPATNGHRRLWNRRPKVERRSIDLFAVADSAASEHEAEPEPELEPEPVAQPALLADTPDWRTMEFGPYPLPRQRSERVPLLDAEGVTVRFGGLTAVDNVSLSVREHEIVGLIGPNGAGKTTTFNAIAGLNEPAAGTVRIFGEDATKYPVHVRAQMGVGRTFQLIQLFPELTVFDNLLVGTHIHDRTGLFSHLVLTAKAVWSEREAREQVRLVIEMLGLGDVADRPVAGLPFGILRQVEIARALVTGSPLLMLDEPASGLDNAETDELMQLLRYLRGEVGVTVLLIEHDVRMVVSVCDYIYVVNQGKPLAEGTPADVQRNPDVIAAYLGQAEGATPAPAPAPAVRPVRRAVAGAGR